MERILFVGLLGLLGYLVYLVFSPFLVPLAWAVVFAIMFSPAHRRLQQRLRRVNQAALVSTVLLAVLIVTPGLLVLGAFANQAGEAVQWVRAEWTQGRMLPRQALEWMPVQRALQWFAKRNIQEEEVRTFVTEKLEALAGLLAAQAGRLARNLAFFLFDLFVTLFATFYLLRDGPALLDRLRRALPLEEAVRENLFSIAHNVLYASVFSGMVVAAVQGLLGGLLFWILGLGAPVLWGMVMGFLALLPVVGPYLVWVPAVLFLFLRQQYGKAALLLVFGVLISLADNVLRPVLISGRAQMNGLLVFISILGGVGAFGLLGIVLGPILVALADAVVEAYAAQAATPHTASASP